MIEQTSPNATDPDDIRAHFRRLNARRRHFYVYRAFDDHGALLYVGSTGHPSARWANHKSTSRWVKYAARFTVQGPYQEGTARQLETEAISSERPFFNATGNPWVRQVFTVVAKRQFTEAFHRIHPNWANEDYRSWGIQWADWIRSDEPYRFNEEWRERHYLQWRAERSYGVAV